MCERVLRVACVVAVLGGSAAAQNAATVAERREALAIARDLRALAESVLGEDQPPEISSNTPVEQLLARLGRPAARRESPGLEPADLDRLIEAAQLARGEQPAPRLDDAAWLRRVYLDLTGIPPTPEQIAVFVADPAPDKHARQVDQLTASEAFARHWARYWRDVISARATSENARLLNFDTFEQWLTQALLENRPWDAIAREILTATGDATESGATALVLAHTNNLRVQPAELAGEASRIFLGIQIACAQCHDHPTDRWTQRQFHELTAFFAGTAVRRPNREQPLRRVVFDRPGSPRHGLPDKDDPNRTTPVAPRFFLDGSAADLPRLTSAQARALAASYFTGPDNPWFARALVNRVWYALTGQAFYLPIDDLGPDRNPEDPEILDALAEAFTRSGYDLRWLYRTIAQTDHYRRERPPARLRADALFDALVRALDLPLEGLAGRVGRNNGNTAPQVPAAVRGRFSPRQLFTTLFQADPSLPEDELLGTIPQALFLMNGPQVHRATTAGPRTLLGRMLPQYPDNAKLLDALYLRVLARHPNPEEQRIALDYVRQVGNRREAFEDILWALVNSAEFLNR
ncbi:MAG: hypothetical protein KatS3mg108_0365 [Isosphaeraceae bacterium]|jgi:hypothetical protein|nr:MAG: hypothetical protein KatS3mg108_0365 [Isosphaeraceae bacterium]